MIFINIFINEFLLKDVSEQILLGMLRFCLCD